jgi:hypothetical protein
MHNFQFFSQLVHHRLSLLLLVILTLSGKPTDILLLDFIEYDILNTGVIGGILIDETVDIKKVVPKEVFLGMFLKCLPLLLYLHRSEGTSDFYLLQM